MSPPAMQPVTLPEIAPLGLGIIGCGNISEAYLTALRDFPQLEIRGLADRNPAAAEARAAAFGLTARPVEALLADPEIDIVLNLTIPAAHLEVGLAVLAAGKHLYAEKPLATRFADGRRLVAEAAARGLQLGSAPDTFLGGAHQAARGIIDAGGIGAPVGGTAFFLRPGHERWHPDPAFYYQPGGGPVLDMAPYYLTQLVNLYGPVAEVAGMQSRPRSRRPILSEPRRGQEIAVEVDTHVVALLAFENGALVQMSMSFDVEAHRHLPLELYGTGGTLLNPDPNSFGGTLSHVATQGEWQELPPLAAYSERNHRGLGLAEMAVALSRGQAPAASGALALHVLEVMELVGLAAETRTIRTVTTRCDRPRPLAESLAILPSKGEIHA